MAEANFEEQLEIVDREYREGCEHALFSMYIYTSAFFSFLFRRTDQKRLDEKEPWAEEKNPVIRV